MRPQARCLLGLLAAICFVPISSNLIEDLRTSSLIDRSGNWNERSDIDNDANPFGLKVVKAGWQEVSHVWPTETDERCDSKYFLFNDAKNENQLKLELNSDAIIKNRTVGFQMELNFFIWIRPLKRDNDQIFVEIGSDKFDLYTLYKNFFGNTTRTWLPYTIRMKSSEIKSFKLFFQNDEFFAAISCFQISFTEKFRYSDEPVSKAPLVSGKKSPVSDAEAELLSLESGYSILNGQQQEFLHTTKELEHSLNELCFQMNHVLENTSSANLDIFINYNNESVYRDNLVSFELQNGKDISFCFEDFIYYRILNYSVSIRLSKREPGELIFKYQFTTRTNKNTAIDFLSPFEENESLTDWHKQWILSGPNFQIKSNQIEFTDFLEETPKIESFFSRWIRVFDNDAVEMNFTLSSSNWDTTNVQFQVCNIVGQCSPAIVNLEETKSSTRNGQLHYNESQAYVQIRVSIEYFSRPADVSTVPSEKVVNVQFRVDNTNHPCRKTRCENNGKCHLNDHRVAVCKCPDGFYGSRCEFEDFCLKNGKELCNDDTVLGCKNLPAKAVCICSGGDHNLLTWDGLRCVEKRSVSQQNSDHIVQSFDELPDFNDFDVTFSLTYDFNDHEEERKFEDNFYLEIDLLGQFYYRDLMLNGTNQINFSFQEHFPLSLLTSLKTIEASFKLVRGDNSLKNKATIKNVLWRIVAKKNRSWNLKTQNAYNDYFDGNQNFVNWTVLSLKDHVFDKSGSKKLTLLSQSRSAWFTVSSDWFKLQESFTSMTLIPTSQETRINAVNMIAMTSTGKYATYKIDNSLIRNSSFTFEQIKKSFNEQEIETDVFVKFIFELVSNSSLIYLNSPLKFESNAYCGVNDTCSNHGICKNDMWNDWSYCKCDKDYYGEKCEFEENPCNENRNFCSKFAINAEDEVPHPDEYCTMVNAKNFDCDCLHGHFEWNNAEKSCTPIYYQEKTLKKLDSQSFEVLALNSRQSFEWMGRDAYWRISKDGENRFFAFSSESGTIRFTLPEIAQDKDLCFTVEKLISDATLGIAFDENEQLILSDDQPTTRVCVRQMMAPQQHEILNAILKISAHFINDKSFASFKIVNIETVPYKDSGRNAQMLEVEADKWSFSYPSSDVKWSTNSKVAKLECNEMHSGVGYLVSRWFFHSPQKYSFGHEHRLFVDFKLLSGEISKISVYPMLFNSKMEDVSDKAITNFTQLVSGENIFKIQFDELNKEEYFRFGFKVLLNNETFTLELSRVSLNDFCGQELKKKCSNQGKCQVNLGKSSGIDCVCDEGYRGEVCEDVDYCGIRQKDGRNGTMVCEKNDSGECLPTHSGFKCSCDDSPNKIWVPSPIEKCEILSTCLIADPCQVDVSKCDDSSGKLKCMCNNGFREVSDNRCEPLDPCSDKQNACDGNGCFARHSGVVAPSKWNGSDTENISCYCRPGTHFNPEKTARTQKYTCDRDSVCDSLIKNPCEQICEPKGSSHSGYECKCFDNYSLAKDGKHCILKQHNTCNCTAPAFCDGQTGSCKCPIGMVVNGTECALDSSIEHKECPGGKAIYDQVLGKIRCDCSTIDLYELDSDRTCRLKPICGESSQGESDCAKKNAICVVKTGVTLTLNTTFKELYECKCPKGQHPDENQKCRDNCFSEEIMKCMSRNAQCDPTAYVHNWSNITDSDWREICSVCLPGFHQIQNGDCVFIEESDKRTYTFELNIAKQTYERYIPATTSQSDVNFEELKKNLNSKDLDQYLKQLSNNVKSSETKFQEENQKLSIFKGQARIGKNMETFFSQSRFGKKDQSLIVRVLECKDLSEKSSVACSFQMETKQEILGTNEDISQIVKEMFLDSCEALPDDSSKCAIFQPKSQAQPKALFWLLDAVQNDPEIEQTSIIDTLLVIEQASLDKMEIEPFKSCEKYGKLVCSKPHLSCSETSLNGNKFECDCSISNQTDNLWMNHDTKQENVYNATINECKLDNSKLEQLCPKNYLYNGTWNIHENLTDIPQASIECFCSEMFASRLDNVTRINDHITVLNQCVERDFCEGVNCHHGACRQVKIATKGLFEAECKCDSGWKGTFCDKAEGKEEGTTQTTQTTPTNRNTTETIITEKNKSKDNEKLFKWLVIGIGSVLALVILVNIGCFISRSASKSRSSSFIGENFALKSPSGGTYRRADSIDNNENGPPRIQIANINAGNSQQQQPQHQHQQQQQPKVRRLNQSYEVSQREPEEAVHAVNEASAPRRRNTSSRNSTSSDEKPKLTKSMLTPSPRMAESTYQPVFKTPKFSSPPASASNSNHPYSDEPGYVVVNPALKNLQAETKKLRPLGQ